MNDYLRNDDEIIFRTEDLKQREIQDKFVETGKDRENIEYLKKKTPIILSGSRGTGKTMLLKMAEKEMDDKFDEDRILPVFVSFSKAIFVDIDKDILYFSLASPSFLLHVSSMIEMNVLSLSVSSSVSSLHPNKLPKILG